ncbi:protein FAM32A-like [Chenopodium quinoa]|uniref:protein FAM32A-like n=1 Tax=Chenopodium quinoa TaxID=63459 RepID=UPI000B7847DE|nr:protein FAM32A-like [Chenopodium quinoa]
MSEYENVIAGKLRLKGKALDVKAGGIAKKKKHRKNIERFITEKTATDLVEINTEKNVDGGNEVSANYDERLTPAERRFLEQWKHLEVRRLLKSANESHRDRVQRFNQYLANLSDHYDIPKVGPG